MKQISKRVSLCAALVLGGLSSAWSAQDYKPCSTITPGGKIPSIVSLEDEIAANYGKEYAAKAVQFLRVLDEKKDVDKVNPSERLRLEFDVLYSFAHEQHRTAYSLRSFLDRLGVQSGAQSAPELKTEVDHYKIAFRASHPWHVYLFQMDATGKIDPLFPNEGIVPREANPVRGNADYQAPPGEELGNSGQKRGLREDLSIRLEEPQVGAGGALPVLHRRGPADRRWHLERRRGGGQAPAGPAEAQASEASSHSHPRLR